MQTDTEKGQEKEQGPAQDETSGAEAAGEEGGSDGRAAQEQAGGSPLTSILALALALLALLAAAGGIGAGYYVWQQAGTARQQIESRLEQNGAALQAARSGLQGLRGEVEDIESRLSADLGAELDGLRAEVGRLRERVAQLGAEQQRGPAPVVDPARVEHLLQIANDVLILERDAGTALAALRLADRRLRALDDPLFAQTRRRLAAEITALESLSRPDIAGMAFTLGSLQASLPSLPLERRQPAGRDAAPPAGREVSGWRAFLRDVWEAIKGLVVIRRSEPEDAPLLKPDQRMFLRQNLYLKLESARLALLDRDAQNFSASLAAAREWLNRYYDTAAPQVSAMIGRLTELGAVEIAPEPPDISGSLDALRAARERRGSRPGGADGGNGET